MVVALFFLKLILFGRIKSYNIDTNFPLIYEFFEDSETTGGYFGMTVSLRPNSAILNGTWCIQIGAPRGSTNNASVYRPGVLYRCHLKGPCSKFYVEETFHSAGGNGVQSYKGMEDEACIGSAMDIKKIKHFERCLVCGNRWINQNLKNSENIDITYLMTGVCYIQDLYNGGYESKVTKLMPLVNSDAIYTPKPYVVNLSTYHWGLGQAGTSAFLVEKPPMIVIGAPGVTHWIGSVIRYHQNLTFSVGNFVKAQISKKNRYSYIGYSVTSGKFYKDRELWYATGAPRSANYRGEVITFQYQLSRVSNENIYIQSTLRGSSFGEYFGHSLISEDINNDGYDDLIVGAPFYSNSDPEKGRIYVYLGTNKGNFLLLSQVISGQISRGQFGFCIATIKDLDQDGYNDIAVSAPYENEQRGTIYIYRGFSMGLEIEYSQRIVSEEIYSQLRGFGISISSAVDVDGNNYNDIAIGSYLSGHVVLLRSRPIISLHPQIKNDPFSLLDGLAPNFNVSFCSKYSGSNAPTYADIIRTIEIDLLYGRSLICSSSSPCQRTIRLKVNESFCEIYTVLLNFKEKNYHPIKLSLKNELLSCSKNKGNVIKIKGREVEGHDGFVKWCPTGFTAKAYKEVNIAGICGSDSICQPDLKVSCFIPQFQNGSYVLGSSEHINLLLNISNSGEAAFNIKMKISSNIKIFLKKKEIDFSTMAYEKVIWHDLDEGLLENALGNFSIQLLIDDALRLEPEKNSEYKLIIKLAVYPENPDIDMTNNKCTIFTQLISDATYKVHSLSSLDSFFINENMNKKELNISHYYEIEKIGVTPILDVELYIYIPRLINEKLVSYHVENSEWMLYEVVENFDDLKFKPFPNRTWFFNSSTSKRHCDILKFIFSENVPLELTSYVKLTMFFNITTAEFIDKRQNIAWFTTFAVLRYKTVFTTEVSEIYESATLTIFIEKTVRKVEVWVIALSFLFGAFFLFIISSVLVKRNFFKRVKKQQLQALKELEASFIYFDIPSQNDFPPIKWQ